MGIGGVPGGNRRRCRAEAWVVLVVLVWGGAQPAPLAERAARLASLGPVCGDRTVRFTPATSGAGGTIRAGVEAPFVCASPASRGKRIEGMNFLIANKFR